MGQYYHPCILKKNWKTANQPVKMTLYSWDYDNGAKLMEHSYVGNEFVMAVMYLLAHGMKGHPFVWCGDYADKKVTKAYPKEIKHEYDGEVEFEGTLDIYEKASDLVEGGSGHGLYELYKRAIPNYSQLHSYKYIINRTKNEYVTVPNFKPNAWVVHPLPLLCADGNGRGGGDYGEEWPDADMVGRWAYDIIDVSDDKSEVKGYKRITPKFKCKF